MPIRSTSTPEPSKELQYQTTRRALEDHLAKAQEAVPPEKLDKLVWTMVDQHIGVDDRRFNDVFQRAGGVSTAPKPPPRAPKAEGEVALIPEGLLPAEAEYGAKTQNPTFWNVVKDLAGPHVTGLYGKTWGVSSDNLVSPKVLVDPANIWGELARLVPSAKSEIGVQTFAWETNSAPAKAFLDSLNVLQDTRKAQKAKTPVNVRLMIDTMPTGMNGNLKPDELRAELQSEIAKRGLDPRYVNVSIGLYEHSMLGSQHAKSVYIDNRVSLITGSNMNSADDFKDGEHDAGFLYGGEAAVAARTDFDQAWAKSTVSEQSFGSWVTNDAGQAPPVKHDFSQLPKWTDAVKDPKDDIDRLLATMKPQVPMAYVSRAPNDHVLATTQKPRDTLNRAVISMINNATTSYKFASANLNEPEIVEALVSAAFRGVKVQGLATRGYEDISEGLGAGTNASVVRGMYERLQRGFTAAHKSEGVPEAKARELGAADAKKFFDFRWSRYDASSPAADIGHAPHSSHVKYASADERMAYNGSLNFDSQSWERSREIGVLVGDEQTVQQWNQQLFDKDFARAVPVGAPDGLDATSAESLARSARLVPDGTPADADLLKAMVGIKAAANE